MSRLFGRLCVCLLAATLCAATLSLRAADTDDEEAIAEREKLARDKREAAKKGAKLSDAPEAKDAAAKQNPFGTENDPDAGNGLIKKLAMPDATPAKNAPFTPAKPAAALAKPPEIVVCPQCKGMGILPNLPYHPYIKFQGQPAPVPDFAPPWKYCDKCQKGLDAKLLSEDMKERQERGAAKHKRFEEFAGKPLKLIQTPFVTIHSQLTPEISKSVANAFEKCAGMLQTNSKSMVLMTLRPDLDDVIMLADAGSYNSFIDKSLAKAEASQRELSKKVNGVHGPHVNVFRMSPNASAESLAVFGLGSLIMSSATNTKAKPWLNEGFSAYCENATLGTNLMSTIAYEANDVKFGKNWNEDMKKFAKAGKLKAWNDIFNVDLIGMKPLEYLTCYSVVSFLIRNDPARFDKFILSIKAGEESAPAIEKAYGHKIVELQSVWLQWIQTQK